MRPGLAALALCCCLYGAGPALAASVAGSTQPITVGIDLYSQIEHRWTYDEQYFEAEAKRLGVNVLIRFADNNSTRQSNDVAALLAKHVNALIVAPVDVDDAGALIAAAERQHVPFIDYDTSVPNARPSYVVVRNQDQACEDQVNYALQFAPSGNYALIEGDAGNDLAQACHSVYDRMLLHRQGIHVVYENWTPNFDTATALTDAENILTRYKGNIKAFVTTNDSMALGVVQALREFHEAGKVYVSGLNADPANLSTLAAGTQMMTIWTPIDIESQAALDAAVALARGKAPPTNATFHNKVVGVPAWFVPNVVVTELSLCSYLLHDSPAVTKPIALPSAGAPTVESVFHKPNACSGT